MGKTSGNHHCQPPALESSEPWGSSAVRGDHQLEMANFFLTSLPLHLCVPNRGPHGTSAIPLGVCGGMPSHLTLGLNSKSCH